MSGKLTSVEQLRATALEAKGLIAQVAGAAAEAMELIEARLGQLESGGGGVDWAETPFTGMTHFNNSSAFGCAWLETEKISSMARIIRGVAVLQVKAASWSGSQTLKVNLPSGYPELTFKDASGTITQTEGTGTGKLSMTSGGTQVSFVLNPDKAALDSGLYVGCVSATIVG